MKWSDPILFSTRRGWGVSAAALLLGALGWVAPMAPVAAQSPSIVVASTTSTEQSGLFGHILPEFTQASGIVGLDHMLPVDLSELLRVGPGGA